jgi:hypothetical protein
MSAHQDFMTALDTYLDLLKTTRIRTIYLNGYIYELVLVEGELLVYEFYNHDKSDHIVYETRSHDYPGDCTMLQTLMMGAHMHSSDQKMKELEIDIQKRIMELI